MTLIEGISILVIIGLTFATFLAFVHAHTGRIAQEDHALSNRQVLWELKNIALHRPHHLVDETGMDKRRWDHRSTLKE